MNIGDYNTLKIVKLVKTACFLDGGGAGRDIYMNPSEVPPSASVGDEIEVFVYNSGKGELRATTKKPFALEGEFAALQVKEAASFGLFLDWGIEKDLFVPARNLKKEKKDFSAGDIVVVKLVPDFEGSGVVGTCRFEDLFDTDTSVLQPNQEVSLLVYGFSPLGARVVIDNRFSGVLYRGEIFEKLEIGDERTGYIKKIREDGLVDAALQPQGFRAASQNARTAILDALEMAGGFLPLHDKSSPEDIKRRLSMSKRNFKQAAGGLYREGLVVIAEDGIRLAGKNGGDGKIKKN